MYKVFVKENPIILTDSKNNSKDYVIIPFEDFNSDRLLTLLSEHILRGIYLYHADLEWMWSEFKSNYKVIEAAGGLVKNEKNAILMIYRFDKWDLPKGKMENGETKEFTAIREVEEECGVGDLRIIKPLNDTYHIYFDKDGNPVLKISHWYEMAAKNSKQLTPQIEEGITMVRFIEQEQMEEIMKNTYSNIKILLNETTTLNYD